ncbi:FecR family protein [Xinfangfangia sp. D13-10-4-6]|uniref:FecR family protein n=1 Tax=Pseudogemmobacter hezensis TaxID=2737662 RepID=UPI00155652D0|nr:FecR family protein [Pseudogemmobacter hezensis]NPD14903.1 FecR family protein [Pseudogemmobacter hezensis]
MAETGEGFAPEGSVRDQALAWFVRINSGDATPVERAGHAAWLAADPGHRAEYQKLGGLWQDLEGVTDPRMGQIVAMPARRLSRRMVLSGGVAASAAGGWLALNGLPDFLQSDEYTGIGVQGHAVLADGSEVDLDADTAFALDYTASARGLRLQRGRAVFEVAPDPRPFRVSVGDGVITALGTKFSVHLWAGMTTVAVEEHAVTVQARGLGQVQVAEGERISFGQGVSGQVETADPATETAWLRGKLIFEDRPLRQVIADVNRYRSGTIRVTSDSLMEMRVSGMFDIANPDGVLAAIEQTLPVKSTHITPWLVVLRPA